MGGRNPLTLYIDRNAGLKKSAGRKEAESEMTEALKERGVAVPGDLRETMDEKVFERSQQDHYRNPKYPGTDYYGNSEPQYNAWMCPECEVGPVGRDKCTDLRTHHAQGSRGGVGGINNACANCGFFADSIDGWCLWDGKVRYAPSS